MEVHSELGPGFLESVYEEALTILSEERGLAYEEQKKLEIKFRDRVLKKIFVADMVVENKVMLIFPVYAK